MGKPPGTWWGYVSWSWRAPLRLRHLTLTPTLWWSCKTKEIWAKGWERAQNVDRTLGQVVYITLEVLQLDERIDVRCGPLSMALPPVALVHQGSHREVHLREHLGRWWSLLPATLQIWKMDLNWILTVIRAQTIGQSPAKQRKIEDLCSRSYWETLGDHGRPIARGHQKSSLYVAVGGSGQIQAKCGCPGEKVGSCTLIESDWMIVFPQFHGLHVTRNAKLAAFLHRCAHKWPSACQAPPDGMGVLCLFI